MKPDGPTWVYYLVDAAGWLVYVGVTAHLPTRLSRHRTEKPWWPDVDTVRSEQYAARADALVAEAHAIAYFRPRGNTQQPKRLARLARPHPITAPVLTWGARA